MVGACKERRGWRSAEGGRYGGYGKMTSGKTDKNVKDSATGNIEVLGVGEEQIGERSSQVQH